MNNIEDIKKEEASCANEEVIYKHKRKIFYSVIKRGFDIFASAAALIVFSVPMVIVAALVWSTSKGSILFKQQRVGIKGKLFYCLKFRTMYITAPHSVATGDLENASEHITRLGKFLRKTSLDELPQFINILRGDMSFVGPRPLIPSEERIHELRHSYGVYNIRPGVTGWAQINGRDKITAEEKAAYDRYYYENRSLLFDIKILFLTVPKVFFGADIVEGKRVDKKRSKKKENKK